MICSAVAASSARGATRSRRRSGRPRRPASARAGRARARARSPRRRSRARCGRCPVPSSSVTSSHGMTRCSTPRCAGEHVVRPLVPEADELRAAHALDDGLSTSGRSERSRATHSPFSMQDVLRVGQHRGGDVRRERPRCRRPDDERLARTLEQREVDEERRVGAVLVRADQLVLRDRRPAARAPDVRAVAHVEPAALVDGLEEPPDVLDVRVAERVVVVVPVHPHAEPLRLLRDHLGVRGDGLDARVREAGEAILLDLPLRVEAELALDVDLDPEALQSNPFW